MIAHDSVVLAAEPQPDAVRPQVRQLAPLDRAIPRPHGLDRPGKVAGRLTGGMPLRRNLPVRIPEPQVLKPQVRHELLLCRLAAEDDQLFGNGGDDGRLRQVLAGERNIRQQARLAVQVPLAGRIQRLGDVLDKVADVAAPMVESVPQRASERDDPFRLVQRRDPLMGDLPRLVHDDHGLVEAAERVKITRLETERDASAGARLAGLGVDDRRSFAGRVEIVRVWHSRPRPGAGR